MNWFVLYTKPQQELKVLERLQKHNIEAYCPVREELKQWSDRKKIIVVPVIKSYVFVRIDFQNRFKVFDVPGVVRYLFWMGKPAVVYDREIVALKSSLSRPFSAVSFENLTAGKRMTISEGPFKDNEGTIVKINAKYVTISLEQLGLLVTVTY